MMTLIRWTWLVFNFSLCVFVKKLQSSYEPYNIQFRLVENDTQSVAGPTDTEGLFMSETDLPTTYKSSAMFFGVNVAIVIFDF